MILIADHKHVSLVKVAKIADAASETEESVDDLPHTVARAQVEGQVWTFLRQTIQRSAFRVSWKIEDDTYSMNVYHHTNNEVR